MSTYDDLNSGQKQRLDEIHDGRMELLTDQREVGDDHHGQFHKYEDAEHADSWRTALEGRIPDFSNFEDWTEHDIENLAMVKHYGEHITRTGKTHKYTMKKGKVKEGQITHSSGANPFMWKGLQTYFNEEASQISGYKKSQRGRGIKDQIDDIVNYIVNYKE